MMYLYRMTTSNEKPLISSFEPWWFVFVVECHTLRGESTHWGWILALRTRFEPWSTPWGAHPNFEGLSCPWGGFCTMRDWSCFWEARSSRWGVELHFEGEILYLEVLSCTFVWFMPFLSILFFFAHNLFLTWTLN